MRLQHINKHMKKWLRDWVKQIQKYAMPFVKTPNTGPLPLCVPIPPCWKSVTRTRAGITCTFLCHSKGNLILCCSVHQTSLCFPVLQMQTKMSSKITQEASHAWIHTEYPQCFNYSQAEAHRIVPTTEEGLLPQTLLEKNSFRSSNIQLLLAYTPQLLTPG